MRAVLGLSPYHGDAAAALVVDGQLVMAVAEERFTRVKHWAGLPVHAMRACLAAGGLEPAQVDCFAIGRRPRAHLVRKAAWALRHRPGLGLLGRRARHAARVTDAAAALAGALHLDPGRVGRRLAWVEHHPAHWASAFLVSPFEEAAVCAIDGFGDFTSTSWALGRGTRLQDLGRVWFPHSLGLLYLAVTQYLGFPAYGDEYKVMGLAAYGAPELADRLRRLVRVERDGRFTLDLAYFRHASEGVDMTWEAGEPRIGPVYTDRLVELLGPARRPDEPITARHQAVAASLQAVFEDAVGQVLTALHRRAPVPWLCLAGGCAMNSVMNGKIRERTPFREVYVQPAAGDDGTALGAAFAAWHGRTGAPRRFVMDHAYWGPAFSAAEATAALDARATDLARAGCAVRAEPDALALCRATALRLAGGQVVGWFQGRMEWGARALGNRSILADPRRPDMREVLNARVKRREPFRPFAPSVLEEALDDYFVGAAADPFMVQVYPVRPERRAAIPAVTHVDGTGRLQTVGRAANPIFRELIRSFEKLTGVPVLLNTSFNESEPIVLTPAEALDCFLRTGLDALVLGQTVVARSAA